MLCSILSANDGNLKRPMHIYVIGRNEAAQRIISLWKLSDCQLGGVHNEQTHNVNTIVCNTCIQREQ